MLRPIKLTPRFETWSDASSRCYNRITLPDDGGFYWIGNVFDSKPKTKFDQHIGNLDIARDAWISQNLTWERI